MTRAATVVLLVLAFATGLVGCRRQKNLAPGGPTVRAIALPENEPRPPDGPGRDAFVVSCRFCHSSRYVFDQPRFSRKIWAAEVDKMVRVYGAIVPPESVGAIVDYLVRVNGAE